MRRHSSSTTMSSKHKPYDMVGRTSIHSQGPQFQAQKPKLIKLIAAMIIAAITLYFIHGIIVPSNYVYGLMIDAGSTGSRIHTFTFIKHEGTKKLKVVHEDFFRIETWIIILQG